MSESLRREMMLFGVDVIVLAPGMVVTPIWDKADAVDATRYDGTSYAVPIARMKAYLLAAARNGLPPETIGEAVKQALLAPRPKPRRAIVPNPISNWIAAALPRRVADRLISHRLGLKTGR